MVFLPIKVVQKRVRSGETTSDLNAGNYLFE